VADAAGLPLADVEASFSLEWQRLFVSPRNGDGYGFAPVNNAKTAPLLHGDGTVTREPGSIVVPVVDLFGRATTSIDLVMYSFSSYGDELEALRNAVKRGVKVRAMLDISTGSPIPYNQRMILKLVECGVDVRVPKHKTKTLHQKFAIVDGIHVFNGSSNFSDKSSAVYAENRFFFQFRPEVVAQFQAEWDLLWDKLSAPAQVEE
jgi:phosphatidylserine/phosphatidylglycerophosphate/cardiolipin synthase-like enzyme